MSMDKRGWAWPPVSRKAHFFQAGDMRSLCGAFAFTGAREDEAHDSPDNCAKCKKLRAKLGGAS